MRRALSNALLLALLAGCGGATTSDKPITSGPAAPPPPLKKMLEDVAATGNLGSAGMEIEQEIDSMVSNSKPGAIELQEDYNELKVMSDPRQVMAKAKAMAAKL